LIGVKLCILLTKIVIIPVLHQMHHFTPMMLINPHVRGRNGNVDRAKPTQELITAPQAILQPLKVTPIRSDENIALHSHWFALSAMYCKGITIP
jgi:hypothetical protein